MRNTRRFRQSASVRLIAMILASAMIPGCGLVGPCSPAFAPGNDNASNDNIGNDNTNTGNDNTGNDNTGNDNTGNDNTGNDNTNQPQVDCDAAKCADCDATSCLNITRTEHFTNGSLNIVGVSTCGEELAIDWYNTDKTYVQTFFVLGDGRSSTVGQFDSAMAANLGGYRVRRNSRPECQCKDCPITATP